MHITQGTFSYLPALSDDEIRAVSYTHLDVYKRQERTGLPGPYAYNERESSDRNRSHRAV